MRSPQPRKQNLPTDYSIDPIQLIAVFVEPARWSVAACERLACLDGVWRHGCAGGLSRTGVQLDDAGSALIVPGTAKPRCSIFCFSRLTISLAVRPRLIRSTRPRCQCVAQDLCIGLCDWFVLRTFNQGLSDVPIPEDRAGHESVTTPPRSNRLGGLKRPSAFSPQPKFKEVVKFQCPIPIPLNP